MKHFTALRYRIGISTIALLLSIVPLYSTEDTATDAFQELVSAAESALVEGDYKSSITAAQDAYSLAEAQGNNSQMGRSLFMEAKALIAQPKKQKSNRKKAIAKLKASLVLLNITSDRATRIASLELLQELTAAQGDHEASAYYGKQITLLQDAAMTSENLSTALSHLSYQRQLLVEKDTLLSQAALRTQLLIALQRNKVDSLRYHMERDSLSLVQTEMRYQEQTAKLSLQKTQKQLTLALLALALLAGAGLFMRYRATQRSNAMLAYKNEIIEAERKKSDELLLNILPAVVAEELKSKGVADARRYESATVFFSDFKGFTAISERMGPGKLVKMLDEYFSVFDRIITEHNLEKIKTIGDAYMCVGGLPNEHTGSPSDVIQAALDIQAELHQMRLRNETAGRPYFEARIGIHTGPVVSGVVGNKKFAFDIWGDTVNIAARMEENGHVGKVNISATTHELVASRFSCVSRGQLPIKNRGEIEMFFVEGLA